MLVSILVRRLRPGVTFEQFRAAWAPDPGYFGRPVRVTHARRVDDDREIVSYAVLDMTPAELPEFLTRIAAGEQSRHDRIDEVIESTIVKGIYEIIDVTELT
jgi:hypothetical protein